MKKEKIILRIKQIVFLIIFVFLAIILGKEIRHYLAIKKEYNKSYSQLTELQKKQEELNQEIDYLNQDKNLLKKARSEMNLLKPGEKVIVLLENNKPKKPASTPQNQNSFFKKIIDFFKP